MRTIDNFNFAGKKALIRVDFNVPLDENFKVTDNTRIEAAKPTIEKILKDGGTAVLMSHLGRPKGERNDKYSLRHIVSEVEKVSNDDALNAARAIAKSDGLMIGISGGASYVAAKRVAKRLGAGKKVLFIAPDNGERYLSTELYGA